jgi:hypothetical protein
VGVDRKGKARPGTDPLDQTLVLGDRRLGPLGVGLDTPRPLLALVGRKPIQGRLKFVNVRWPRIN